jgi:hypothetical protein
MSLAALISEYLRGQDFRIDVELRGDIVARRTSCKFVFSYRLNRRVFLEYGADGYSLHEIHPS